MNPVRVLVLVSDIQIGRFGLFDFNSETHMPFAHELAIHIRKRYDSLPGGKPTYGLFALGDLASRAHRTEYQRVEEFLLVLAGTLGIRRRDIYLCPGNHDYDLSKCDSSAINERFDAYSVFHDDFYSNVLNDSWGEWEKAKSFLEKRLSKTEFGEADTALNQSCVSRSVKKKHPARIAYYDKNEHLGVEVLSYNSANRCSKTESDRYGWFPHDEIAEIVPSDPSSIGCVRICIGHHNFDAMNEKDSSPIRNPWEQREFLRRHGFRFVFHGHQHRVGIQRWSHDLCETVLVGCGSVAADVKELVAGVPHHVTCVVLDETFATIESFPYSYPDKSWKDEPSAVHRVGLTGGQVSVFRTRESVSKANRDLILAARRRVDQTYIKSNAPRNDALIPLLKHSKGVAVHRVLSARSFYPDSSRSRLEFARSCVEMAKDSNLNVRVDYFEPTSESEYPYVNLLLVDDTDVIINFSRAESCETDALHIREPSVVDLLLPFFKSYVKKPLSEETLRVLEAEDLMLGPGGAPQEFIEDLKSALGERVKKIEIVGSTIHQGLAYPARVYDVDIMLLADDVNEDLVSYVSQITTNLSRKHSNRSMALLIEDRFGPFRPRLPGPNGPVTVQMHLVLIRPQDLEDISYQMRMILFNGNIEMHESTSSESQRELLTSVLDDSKEWSFAKLKTYCTEDWFPFSSWGQLGGVFGRVRSRYVLREPWERIEFYGFIARLTLMQLMLVQGKLDGCLSSVFSATDSELIHRVQKDYRTNTPSQLVKNILHARRLDRQVGIHQLKDGELEGYQIDLLHFLQWSCEQVQIKGEVIEGGCCDV